jgi:redox-sensitive bicupin YhaK (pirin superfamily)
MIYADAILETGSKLPIPAEHDERAVYVVEGTVSIAGDRFECGRLLILHPGDAVTVEAVSNARVLVLGGEPMDGPRFIWWNFVASSKERIEAAKADWKAGRFDVVPDDSEEFIPLPER